MQKSKWLRLVALLFAFTLIAASCGDDDDDSGDGDETSSTSDTEEMADTEDTADTEEMADTEDTADTEAAADTGEAPEATGLGDGVLTVGTLLPETGDLAFLGPPEIAGAKLAVQDINEAGGVNGEEVELVLGDSGDTTVDVANPTVDRLLTEGADVIVGAASSAVSKTVIDKITGAGVIQFSPANTSADFTTYDDDGLYFRTAPSDDIQGKVLADLVAGDGNTNAAVLYRQESYGTGLAESFRLNFEAQGGVVEDDGFLAYAVDTENFDSEIEAIEGLDPEAIVVIGFAESAAILTTMNERGLGPTDRPVYGVDGNIGGIGAELEDPSIIAGMKGTEPSVDLSTITDFTDRIEEVEEVDGVYAYGAETYDAIIITALAATLAGSDNPADFASEINGVTKDGDKCTTYAECVALIDGGSTDIDYDGIGGPYEFIDAGEPAAASFRIATYDGGDVPNTDLDEYVIAS